MRKGNRLLNKCGRIMSIVILLSFLKIPVFGEPLTGQPPTLNEEGTRFYSDLEVDLLIDSISEIAIEAIEQAAAEAARAAVLAALEREAALLREAERWRREAEQYQLTLRQTQRNGWRNITIAGLSCLVGGFVLGFAIR